MDLRAWLAVSTSLWLFSCGGSSGGMPPAAGTPTAQVGGDWTVTATFVSGSGACELFVGQSSVGAITIEQNGTSITVHDESGKTASGTVTGSSVEFTYTAIGVTQTWEVEVVDNETRLEGEITVDGLGCHAVAEVTGTRPSAARSEPERGGAPRAVPLDAGQVAAARRPDGSIRVVTADEPTELVLVDPLGRGGRGSGLFEIIARHFVH